MALVNAIVGALSLLLGRQLFWLFVGAAGFLLGFELALQFLGDEAGLIAIFVALVAGVLGSLLALFAQRLALAIAGFIAGGYVLLYLFDLFGAGDALSSPIVFVIFIVGGLMGAGLIQFVFDGALIVLSAAVGATLLTQAIASFWALEDTVSTVLFVGLLVVGSVVQWGAWQRSGGVREHAT